MQSPLEGAAQPYIFYKAENFFNAEMTELENNLVTRAAKNLEFIQPGKFNLFISTTALHLRLDSKQICNGRIPDNIIFVVLIDPIKISDPSYFPNLKAKNYLSIGYTTDHNRVDFFAIYCKKFLEQYSIDSVMPESFDNIYICYNRRPRPHRSAIYQMFQVHNVLELGVFTFSNVKNLDYDVPDVEQPYDMMLSARQRLQNSVGTTHKIKMPNDHSLGRMDLWNSHFVNIVSETEFRSAEGYVFFSEKIFKPIVGCRPFILNSNYSYYEQLKRDGFDTFEDIFDIPTDLDLQDWEVANSIVENIRTLEKENLPLLYDKIKNRLIENRRLYENYVKKQIHKGKLIFLPN